MTLPNFVFCLPHFTHLISAMASQSWFASLGTLIPATCLLIAGNVFLIFCSYCLSHSLAMTSGSSLGKQTITWACARVMICIALELFPFSLFPLQEGVDREGQRAREGRTDGVIEPAKRNGTNGQSQQQRQTAMATGPGTHMHNFMLSSLRGAQFVCLKCS